MGCCPKQFGKFFEQGFGRIWLIVTVLLIVCYVVFFTIVLAFPKAFPPDTLIRFQLDHDLFISENYSGYKGYIRFEESMVRLSGLQSQQLTVKIVLEFQKDAEFKHDVKIEIFDKNNDFISDLILRKGSFSPVESGYSYNKLTLGLLKNRIEDVIHFKYSFIGN